MGSDGNLYVADQGNNTIRKVTPAGVVETLAGLAGNVGSADGVGSAARFKTPTGISADDSGNLYVADLDNNLIRKITSGGTVTTIAGTLGSTSVTTGTGGTLNRPMGIALGSGGVLYTVGDNAVLRITP
jgi:DNA-binding beta-propeller fold protein YncE